MDTAEGPHKVQPSPLRSRVLAHEDHISQLFPLCTHRFTMSLLAPNLRSDQI